MLFDAIANRCLGDICRRKKIKQVFCSMIEKSIYLHFAVASIDVILMNHSGALLASNMAGNVPLMM